MLIIKLITLSACFFILGLLASTINENTSRFITVPIVLIIIFPSLFFGLYIGFKYL